MYLVDTNVLSELRIAKGKANQQVVAWANSVPKADLYVSVISLLELEMGVLMIERKDNKQGTMLRTWLDFHVLPEFSERTLDIDTKIALRCAKLHVPDPCSDRDGLIAATAIEHNMIVVTKNTQDFQSSGVPILNPWEFVVSN